MLRRLAFVSFLALLVSAALALPQAPATLVLLHTNDMHGQVLPREGVGGMAELATLIRSEHPDLLVDAGDMFTGTMICDEYLGKPMIEIMNRLGYVAVALGNHDLDYGVKELRSRLKEAQFPVLSANVRGVPEVQPYTILSVKGVRIGVIGLTVENLAEVTHPKNLSSIAVASDVAAIRETLPKVRPLSDFVVLLAHASFDEQVQVAKAFPEIRLIVAGHPHVARATQVGQTLIVETGSSLQYLGKVEIRLAGKKPESMTSELIPIRNVAPDPEIQSIVAPYERATSARAAERLGEATADLSKSETQESPLNNWIADAVREYAGTQVAFENVGGIRAPLKRGVVTAGAVFEILPFQNTLVKMNLTGAQIKRLLGRRVLAISGLRVVWDLTRASADRLVSVTLADGQPIQDSALYSAATNDFLAAGGDGFVEFTQGASMRDSGILLRDVMAAYLKDHPAVSGTTDGRVTIRTR